MMKEQEIIEGNKLIAEFMGLKLIDISSKMEELYKKPIWVSKNFDESDVPDEIPYKDDWQWDKFYPQVEKLSYHSSWDWLMPVVEKIESLGFWVKIMGHTSFDNKYKSCDIKKQKSKSDGDYLYNYEGDWMESKIESVWLAVVEFIKWYNI